MKKLIAFGLSVLLLASVLAGCDIPFGDWIQNGGSPTGTAAYEYIKDESTYKLTINQSKAAYTPVSGDTYILVIITGGQTKTSSGTVTGFSNSVFTLKPSNSTVTFTVQMSGNTITKISGTITLEGSGGSVEGPDTEGGSGNSDEDGNTEDDYSIVIGPGTGTIDDPILMTVTGSATSATIAAILAEIDFQGKYVNLDLSAMTSIGTFINMNTNTTSTYFSMSYLADTGADKIVTLTLPNTAQTIIGEGIACINLALVSGANVKTIGYMVFNKCTSLIGVNFPAAITIEVSAFNQCINLTSVNLPAITTIGSGAFIGCTSLTSVSFPAATAIGSAVFGGNFGVFGAFIGCTSLTSVSFPAATFIGYQTFQDCTSLASVSFPTATTIGDRAFKNCISLNSVSFPAVTTMNSEPWNGGGAFDECTNLTSVSLPVVTTIGDFAFNHCVSLIGVSFPAATTIGDEAFNNCSSLSTITLPASLSSIGGGAFWGCESLATVTCNAITPPTVIETISSSDPNVISGSAVSIFAHTHSSLVIKVPSGSVAAYKAAWSYIKDKIISQ